VLSTAGLPTQAQPLFVGTAFGTPAVVDANVLTDATGFKYKLKPITADLKGTFLLRAIFANYGYKADTDYKIDSTAFATIQVNTATADLKISGNNCVDCHGTGTLGAHDARHSVVFSTDECLSCHDKSGNHADPIDNRVHAIHAASKTGDKLNSATNVLNWFDVTYPQGQPTINATTGLTTATGAPRCATCHSSGNATYKTSVSENSCIGCHADKQGAIDHFKQMGGK